MQHILGLVRRCVEDYNMIEAGETVAVGVSGGKDSLLTLTALARLRAFYPKPFRVEAITLETGMPGMDFSPVADYCAALDVPYTRIRAGIRHRVQRAERKEPLLPVRQAAAGQPAYGADGTGDTQDCAGAPLR